MIYLISIDNFTQYYSSQIQQDSKVGSASDPDKTTAIESAKANASSGLNPSYPTPANANDSSNSKMFGMNLSTSMNYTNISAVQRDNDITGEQGQAVWHASATANKSFTGKAYEVKLKFTLPAGITSNNIKSARLKSNCSTSWSDTSAYTFAVYAPTGGTEQTGYIRPRGATVFEKMASFSVKGTTRNLDIDITTILKRCLDKKQGWITLGRDASDVTSSPQVTLTDTTTIEYELNYSNCTEPSNIQFTQAGVLDTESKSGVVSRAIDASNVTVTWNSGGGGKNNAVAGYTVYYSANVPPTKQTATKIIVTGNGNNDRIANINVSSFTRGVTYYVKIVTNGEVEGFDSDISEDGCNFTINSLPNAPTVSVNQSRIKSTGSTTIIFTVTPGADVDTSQTKTLYYSTSSSGNKISFNSPLSQSLEDQATYYFWTKDGLEFSENYTSKTITRNQAPSVSVTMSAYNNQTFSPVTRNGYVKNINGTATVGKDSAATLTYQWKLLICNNAVQQPNETFGTEVLIASGSTSTTTIPNLTNIDVTSFNNGVTFNRAYKLALTITDDIGETATGISSKIFAIPAAPTITNIYNQKSNDYADYSNRFHFENGMRLVYSGQNTGITRELQYATQYNGTYTSTNLNNPVLKDNNYVNDLTLSSFTRGTYYYFKVKYTLSNTISTYAVIEAYTDENPQNSCWYNNDQTTTKGFMRALDITPNNIIITPSNGSTSVKPYTDSSFTVVFGNQPIEWKATLDVNTNYSSIYKINIKGNGNSITLTTTGENRSGIVTLSKTDFSGSISTAGWKTITGTTRAPNKAYTLTLEIIATNGFGKSFIATKTFTADFIEKVNSFGANGPELRIQTGTNEYTKIPSEYNNPDEAINRYPIFEGQTLQLAINGLTAYADSKATIYFMLLGSNTSLGTASITSSDWTAPSGYNHLYTLNVEKTILYKVPKNTSPVHLNNVRNFYVKVVLLEGNNTTTLSTESGQNNGNLETCIHYKFDLNSVRLTLSEIAEAGGSFNAKWNCTNFGGMTSITQYTQGYSSISLQLRYDITSDGNYNNGGSSTSLSGVGTGDMPFKGYISSSASINNDIVYFGVYATYVLAFRTIPVNGIDKTPTGQTTYTSLYKNLIALYRATPNLLYGTNFFVLNASSPLENITDQVLELHPGRGSRNKIYFHTADHYIEINDANNKIILEGMLIDGGTWNNS